VKGVGEIGVNGSGAAIANAIFNATGVRVRDFPITLELDGNSWLATEKAFFAAFDDINVEVLDQVAEGDKVASRWSMAARQTAEFYGVPSRGRTATVTGTYIDVIRDGKIVEQWSEMSLPQFMQALSAE
jgi:predicted ester cyclase